LLGGPRLYLASLVIALAAAGLPALLPVRAHAAPALAGQGVSAWSEPTPIYGLERLYIGVGGGLSAAAVDPASGLAVIGGDGYVAAVDLMGRRILWASGVEGVVTQIAIDSEGSPSYAAVATSEGEVAVYSLPQGGLIARYYTGHDDKVVGVSLARAGDGVKLVVLTAEGYARIYRVGSPYWAEIGPEPGEQALRAIRGLRVVEASPVISISGWDSWVSSSSVLLRYTTTSPDARASLGVSVYYNEGSQPKPAYSYSGRPLQGNPYILANATLKLWLVVEPYGVLESLSGARYPVEANFTGLINGLYPGLYRVIASYHYIVYNANTSEIIEDKCYTGESEALELVPGDNASLELVLGEGGSCGYTAAEAPLVPVIILDTTGLPEGLNVSKPRYRLLPGLAGASVSSMEAFEVEAAPPGILGSGGVRGLLILNYAEAGHVLVEYLDRGLEPVNPSAEYVEDLIFRSPASSAAVAPDLSRIYIGTSAGTLYRLLWVDSEGRYVASNSIEATGDEGVAYIMPRPWGVVVAVGAGGLAQAVNESGWKPLWAGGPGYPYLQLPLGGAGVLGAWSGPKAPLVVAPKLGEGYPYLLVASAPSWGTPPLSRVAINASVVLESFQGPQREGLGEGSYIEALSGGEVVARSTLTGGAATLYLPPGSYGLRINATAWGVALRSLEVGGGDIRVDWTLTLREARLTVYAPQGPPPGYGLVSGPVGGVNVTLQPTGYSGNLTYQPLAPAVGGLTGSDGTLSLILWSGVEYEALLEKEGFVGATYRIGAWGVVNETLEIRPKLYNVTFKALDSEALEEGLSYPAKNATIRLTLDGRTLTLQAPNGTLTIGLPEGNYTVTLEAPAYEAYTGSFSVPLNKTLEAPLRALYYPTQVAVVVQDTLTGMASGPLAGARVNVTLVDPPIRGVGGVVFTDNRGTASLKLRAGLYRIVVSHPYTQDYVGYFHFNGTKGLAIEVHPRYSNVSIDLYDSELYSSGVRVGNATVALTYEGVPGGGGLQLEALNGVLSIVLPYGPYTLYAEAPGYEEYGPQMVVVSSPNQSVRVYMAPMKYQVKIGVMVRDPLWHLAEGPASGALLTVSLLEPRLPLPPVTGYTGSDGTAELLLRGGVYRLTISYPYTGNTTYTLAVWAPVYTAITLTPAYTNATIIVLDSETGALVPNATVTLGYSGVGRGGSVRVLLANGSATLQLPPGLYTASVLEKHYHEATVGFTLYGGEPVTLRLELDPLTVQVNFTLTASTSSSSVPLPQRPLGGASVLLTPVDPLLKAVNASPLKLVSGPDGVVTAYIRVGVYEYSVERPGYTSLQGVIEAFKPSKLRLSLTPILYNVTLRIIDPQLEPQASHLENVTVLVVDWDGVPVGRSLTLSSGATLRLPWGNYTLEISKAYYNTTILGLTVTGNIEETVEMKALEYPVALKLLPAGVKGVSGGLAGVGVIAVPEPPLNINETVAVTNDEGVATLSLRAGTYKILILGVGLEEPLPVTSNLTVRGPLTASYSVTPPLCRAVIKVLDSEAPIGVGANLTLAYRGPYGRGSISLEAPGGVATADLPCGYYTLTAAANLYKAYTMELNITKPEGVAVTISLEPLRAPLTLTIVDPDGNPVDGALVRLEYQVPELSPPSMVSINGTVKPRGGVRVGSYKVYIEPPRDGPLEPTTLNLTVGLEGYSTRVVLPYKTYTVIIQLIDAETGKPIPFPYKLNVTRLGAAKPPLLEYPTSIPVEGGSVNATLPYGTYRASLAPVKEDYYVVSSPISFTVNRDGEYINITLDRRIYTIILTVVNDRSEPLPGALVELVDTSTHRVVASGFTSSSGTVTLKAAYGVYEVDVAHKAYKRGVSYIFVPAQTTPTVTLYPTPTTILRRMAPLLVGVVGVVALAAVLWRVRGVIAARLAEQEEYF